jgi:hypothetical protein
MAEVSIYEPALLAGGRIDGLKTLVALKTSSLIGCPF